MENNALVPAPAGAPAKLFTLTPNAAKRVLEFFTARLGLGWQDLTESSALRQSRKAHGQQKRFHHAGAFGEYVVTLESFKPAYSTER